MQKVVNVLAVASAVVSLAVVGLGGYVFINKDKIVEDVKEKVQEAVLGSLGGLGGGLAPELPTGSNDLPSLGGGDTDAGTPALTNLPTGF